MNIQQAITEEIEGYPILRLTIDGKPAYVLEPKQTLLDGGIVVLLDDAGYWSETIRATYREDGTETVLNGASDNGALVNIVRRFAAGETGNLLK